MWGGGVNYNYIYTLELTYNRQVVGNVGWAGVLRQIYAFELTHKCQVVSGSRVCGGVGVLIIRQIYSLDC